MDTPTVIVLIIAVFFLLGAVVGIAMVIALPNLRSRNVRYRYKDSDLSLDPDDPHDAEKIVQRWLEKQDGWADGER